MKKLPPGEALARHIARNKAKNEKRKAALIAHKIANGIPIRESTLSEERKVQMREYSKNRREEIKAGKPPKKKKAKPGPKKTKTPTIMQAAIRQIPPKPARQRKPDLFKQTPVPTMKNRDEGKIPFVVKPGLTVMIRPDQDREQVRARYLNRE